MVCSQCKTKLGQVITPDPWKSGARNTTESGQRRVNENKALTAKKNRFSPYTAIKKCSICNASIHQKGSVYCQGESGPRVQAPHCSFLSDCAYKKGICAMCGKKLFSTAQYKQSAV